MKRRRAPLAAGYVDRQRVLNFVLVVAPLIGLAHLGHRRRWLADDAAIGIRVARNLYEGHGPVFNVGERVEATGSSLWVGTLWLAHVLFGGDWGREAVYAGLVLGLAGCLFALLASVRLASGGPGARGRVRLPLGILVLCALPPMWDFLTSGFETGLILGWLGFTYWMLVRAERPARPSLTQPRQLRAAAVIGLGLLLGSGMSVMVVAFAACLLLLSRVTVRGVLASAAALLLLPLAWQVFRMGYYASLLPTPVIARDRGAVGWSLGTDYLWNFLGTYWLLVPLSVLVLLVVVPRVRRAVAEGGRGRAALWLTPVVGGVALALQVTLDGGDFMHGRLLLPALFSLLLPMMVVDVTFSRAGHRALVATGAAVGVVAVWALVVGTQVRPAPFSWPDQLIADERGFTTWSSREDHPYSAASLADNDWYRLGVIQQEAAERGQAYYVEADYNTDWLGVVPGHGVVARRVTIGYFGYAAPDVLVADGRGRTDAVGARLDLPEPTYPRPGLTQNVPAAWHLGRFTPETDLEKREVKAARAVLACGDVAGLLEAISEPLTLQRFGDNVVNALAYTRLSIPGDPVEAEERFCG